MAATALSLGFGSPKLRLHSQTLSKTLLLPSFSSIRRPSSLFFPSSPSKQTTRRRPFSVRVRASGSDSTPGSVNGSGKEPEYDFDLFTIGAGSGGVRASRFAANYGAKVAVCELPFATVSSESAGGIGGTCVLRGCVPKKLLVYSSMYSHEFEESRGFGWNYETEPKHDWSTLMANKNAELQRLTGIYKNILNSAGVTLIEGRGKIVDPHTIAVDGKLYTARHILISVGGRPFIPDIPGKEYAIDSDIALDLPSRPNKISIVGGGYIALEFAGIFNGLRSDVHIFIRQKKVLRGFDEEVRDFVAEQMSLRGIEFHTEESPQAIIKSSDGLLSLKTNKGTLDGFSHVMFATGRRPNTKNLGLEEVGVKLSQNGAILVDEYSRTTVDSIWAVGDVTDRINLTLVALMEGGAFAKTLFGNEPIKPDYSCVLRGCVPKKLLVYSSKYSHEFEESRGFGWNYETEPKHDWSTLMANKNAELQCLTGIYKNILNSAGVTLIEGQGKNLGLEEVGVKLSQNGAIFVDEYSRTTVDSIWAVGDVTDRINLTPVALMEGGAFAKTLFGNEPIKPDYRAVPSAVFSQPPIGQVGLSEEQAIEEYGDVDIYTSNFRPLKATLSGLPDRIFMKIIVFAKTNKVLGVHMCGDDSAEIIQGIAIPVKAGLTKADFDATIGVHPTSAEEFVTMRSPTRKIRKSVPSAEEGSGEVKSAV